MYNKMNWTVKGKTVIITGVNNSGIGKTTALNLAALEPKRLILACRNVEAGDEAADDIRQKVPCLAPDAIVVRRVDLACLDSVRAFANEIIQTEPELHILINNADVIGPLDRQTTPDGYELTFATNHLGHFLLTNLLLDLLKKSAPCRVIMVSGDSYKFCWPRGFRIDDPHAELPDRYSSWPQYCQTKLANILFAVALHARLNENSNGSTSGVSVFALHPGVIVTDLARQQAQTVQKMFNMMNIFTKSAEQGAATTVFCATQPGLEKHSGCYFINNRPRCLWQIAKDMEMANKLWELSEQLTGLQA